MSIVQDRLNANKPAPSTVDPKSGKLPQGAINNNKDLDVEFKKEEPSFFGSFFAGGKAAAKKKGGPVMEAVSCKVFMMHPLNLNTDGLGITSFYSCCLYNGTATSSNQATSSVK